MRIISGKFLAALLVAILATGGNAAAKTITIALIGEHNTDTRNGLEQGVSEANLQGSFLGYSMQLQYYEDTMEYAAATAVDAVMTSLRGDKLAALLAAAGSVPVFYVGSPEHELTQQQCATNLLQVLPPPASLIAAAMAWEKAKPDKSAGTATAWHPSFVKFAARDLNKRYKASFNTAMTADAWGGWAAIKAVATAFSSGGKQAVTALADPQQRPELGFDGQKGQNMSFSAGGLLPQLILMDNEGELLGEAPGLWPDEPSGCAAH